MVGEKGSMLGVKPITLLPAIGRGAAAIRRATISQRNKDGEVLTL